MPNSWKERAGNSPGTYGGDSHFNIHFLEYDAVNLFEQRELSLHALKALPPTDRTRLLIFRNYNNTQLLDTLRELYKIHSLTLEDLVNPDQRAKHEIFTDYEACLLPERTLKGKSQAGILLSGKTVLLFLENSSRSVEHVLRRIREAQGRIRERGAGYLGYALLDSIVDQYFLVLEETENQMKELDSLLEEDSSKEIAKRIFSLKRFVLELKKETWPLREMLSSLLRSEESLFFLDKRNKLFFRDLQDHVQRILESTDTLRDAVYSLVEIHSNLNSSRMNEIMKLLTLITTIFTPMMFLASIYGMNFSNIPELRVPHGYACFWIFSLLLSGIQVMWFRRKKWL